MYITFEGVDTSGKTTQIELLKKEFQNAIFTKEPGGTELGTKIRHIALHEGIKNPKAELLLFLADRAEHFQEIIKPNRDKVIFSDRGFISGIAYAYANHKEIDLDFLIKINLFALDETLPDKVILIETNKELIKKRMGTKKEDFIEQRGVEYLLRVQEIMLKIIQRLRIDHIVIDASKPIEKINKEIINYLRS